MKRRQFLQLGALGGLLSIGACATMPWGRGNPYYSGPVSSHFDGKRFFNPGGTPPNGFDDFLKWQFGGGKVGWPDNVAISPAKPDTQVQDLRVTMVGHASVLIQIAGRNILTDPVWSYRASPFSFAGPARVTSPGIAFDALPPIDAILLTHNHYDHLDVDTLARLNKRFSAPVITSLGNDTIIRNAVSDIDIRVADWGDVVQIANLSFTLTPCHHWSARGARDRSCALWSAFLIDSPVGRVFHIGDTGFDNGNPYRNLPEDIRLAILPIGAYAPRWFMKSQHQNPAEAVAGFRISGAHYAVGHHWGTFQLTNESREEPPELLVKALNDAAITEGRFRPLSPGDQWDIPI